MPDLRHSEPVFRVAQAAEVTDAELARAAEILHAAFPRWPGRYRPGLSDAEHLRWKLDAPGDPPGCMTFAEIDGGIVGLALHLALRVLIRGEPRVARYSTDSAIHPDYQDRGIFSKRRRYTEVALDGRYDLNLGITHNPKMIHSNEERRQQWISHVWRTFVRPYDVRRMSAADAREGQTRLRTALYGPGVRALSLAGRLRHGRRAPAKPSFTIRETRAIDERADLFARRAAAPFDLIQLRDRRFLHWRYLDPRAARSTLLVAEERSELLGYVAYRTEAEEGYLLDVLALPGRLDVVRALVRAADQALRESGVMRARCWLMLRHPYAGVLRGCGFVLSRYDTGLSYRPLRMDEKELEFIQRPDARIHLTAGDFDGA